MHASPNTKRSAPNTTAVRPDCMVMLELLPPYALEDIKQAYLTKAHASHPDHGGSTTDFLALQDAYQAAKEYITYRGDRRQWIASMVERSMRQDKMVDQLKSYGAEVTFQPSASLQQSLGDFAVLMETISTISLSNSPSGDKAVDLLVEHEELLASLQQLRLVGCPVHDDRVELLRTFVRLTHLDLSRTAITDRSLSIVRALPALTEIRLGGTDIGWWARRKAYASLRRRKIKSAKRDRQTKAFREMFQSRTR